MMPQPVALPELRLPRAVASDPDLTMPARLAFMAIWSSVGANGLCTDRLADLAGLVDLSERTMRDALRLLVDRGYLTPIRRDGYPTAWRADPGSSRRPTPAAPAALPRQQPPPPALPPPRQLPPPLTENDEEIWPSQEPTPAGAAAPARARPSFLPSVEKNSKEEERKEGKEGAGRKPSAPRRMPLPCPEDYAPSPKTLALVTSQRPDVDASYELAKFVRYFTEGKGSRDRRPEWDQSFIRWMERADASPTGAAAAPGGARADGDARRLTPTGQRLMAMIRGSGT